MSRSTSPGHPGVIVASLVGVAALASAARAGIVEYEDASAWQAAVGEYTTLGFADFEVPTFVTDQYEDEGVIFTGGEFSVGEFFDSFPIDGWGLDGSGPIEMSFTQPMQWIAADHPGPVIYELYFQGELIGSSSELGTNIQSQFTGVYSTRPFDAVILTREFDPVFISIDDLHFGPPVPAPAAWIALAGLGAARRRRRGDAHHRRLIDPCPVTAPSGPRPSS